MNKQTLVLVHLLVSCAHCIGSSFVEVKDGEKVIGTINPGSCSAKVKVFCDSKKVELLRNDTVIEAFSCPNKIRSDYDIPKLEPSTDYKLTIRTRSSSNQIINTYKLFRTNSINLSSVENIEYDTVNGLLTWMPPKSESKCIKTYRIEFNETINYTNSGSYSLAHLSGCLTVDVQIKAMDTYGSSRKIATKTIKTGIKNYGLYNQGCFDVTQQAVRDCKFNEIPHPPYSLDLTPSDYFTN